MRRAWLLALLGLLPSPLVAQTGSTQQPDPPPAGFGSLRQDEVAIRLQDEHIVITILPLAEWVTRLLAPDSYNAVHQLFEARAHEIAEAARRAGYAGVVAFLVMVYALDDQVPFDPDDIAIQSRGRTFRPAAVVPISARWGEYRLPRRETASAIFLFDEAVDVFAPVTVQHAGLISTTWESTLRRLEVERARVEARAKRPRGSLPRASR